MSTLSEELQQLRLSGPSEPKGKGLARDADVEAPEAQEEQEEEESGPVCAICLGNIALQDVAMLPSCDHVYCVHCIVHWASLREDHALCPQCKVPFSEVISYRNLDGTLQDFPVQNPVCLMRRAGWFQSIAGQHAEDGRLPEPEGSWGDDFAEAFDEDEELEDYYFSSAAGRARIVFGNRRFGEGGYIASGRRQARAAAEAAPRKRVGKRGKATVAPPEQAAARGQASASIPISRKQREQSVPGAQGQSPPLGSSPAGSGRRATRNARRSAVDSY